MGFRKTAYAKVFVDESIPSFLTQPAPEVLSEQAMQRGASNVSPALMSASNTAQEVISPIEIIETERRNRSFQLRPSFMLRLVLLAVFMNMGLYLTLNAIEVIPQPQAYTDIAAAQPLEATASPEADPRVVSYSLSYGEPAP
jgi:hypothetical protein